MHLRRRLKLKIILLAGIGLAGWLLAFGIHIERPVHPPQAHSRGARPSWIEVFDFLPVVPPRPPCSAYHGQPPPSA